MQSFKTFEVDTTGERTRLHYTNPFDENPYTDLAPIKDLCYYWKIESAMRENEIAIIRQLNKD